MCLAASALNNGVLQYWKNRVAIRLRRPAKNESLKIIFILCKNLMTIFLRLLVLSIIPENVEEQGNSPQQSHFVLHVAAALGEVVQQTNGASQKMKIIRMK